MKFTDGFWVIKPGVSIANAAQVRDVRVEADQVVLYAAPAPVVHRGMTLQGPLLTLRFASPAPDVLALKIAHFTGENRKEPHFALNTQSSPLSVQEDGQCVVIEAGKLRATVQKSPFRLDYHYDGQHLTGLRDRHLGYVQTPEGAFVRVKLDVGVGEKIYGLGERFTPFVKNGQSVDIWNEDGGTASELAYKNIPFYVTSHGYGVFVNSTDRVSYELCSEAVTSAQFSVPGESLEFMIIGGPGPRDAVARYARLTGLPALPPAWSFGLWLSTSFTTDYSEKTVTAFVDGMVERRIPLHVFHFDCFWMKEYEWCNFSWDDAMFPDPEGMLTRLKAKGLKICVWINPYIGQKSPLFAEGMAGGYLLKRPDGGVWQWDRWQPGMALVDFTNPDAQAWYCAKLRALMDMGVDCFKTDFGERIPTDVVYHSGHDPQMMHNYYAYLYNQTVFELLQAERGEGDACVFARSATAGGQQFPVHWGGDSSSNYPSMAESLRAGLSLCMSGFAFWSHDISGFEDMASPDVYKRWVAFGLLSTHSRLHGSSSYRVPWLFDEEASDVLRHFTALKCRLMPYLFAAAVQAHRTGMPMMRAMVLEFADDPACEDLDMQYMLGDSLLVAPIFREDGVAQYYLPAGTWTHLLSGEMAEGGRWYRQTYDYFSLPLFVREGSLLPLGDSDADVVYDYLQNTTLHAYHPVDSRLTLYSADAARSCTVTAQYAEGTLTVAIDGDHGALTLRLHGRAYATVEGAAARIDGGDTVIEIGADTARVVCRD